MKAYSSTPQSFNHWTKAWLAHGYLLTGYGCYLRAQEKLRYPISATLIGGSGAPLELIRSIRFMCGVI